MCDLFPTTKTFICCVFQFAHIDIWSAVTTLPPSPLRVHVTALRREQGDGSVGNDLAM